MFARIIDWNGKDMPAGLVDLPPGQYRIRHIDDLNDLAQEEKAGLRQALDSLDASEGDPVDEVMEDLKRRCHSNSN